MSRGGRASRCATSVRTLALAASTLVLLGAAPVGGAAVGGDDARAAATARDEVDTLLLRAAEASRLVAHRSRVSVVSFSDRGPTVAELLVHRDGDTVRLTAEEGPSLAATGPHGALRHADRLMRVPDVAQRPEQLALLHHKYVARVRPGVELETGAAVAIELHERASDVLREVLYLDEATGLVVRRETFGRDGVPVRVVAFTDLVPESERPTAAGRAGRVPADATSVASDGVPASGAPPPVHELRGAGFVVPEALGAGYRLLAASELSDTVVPTVHLLYGDGLYVLSVFEQHGRLAATARSGAHALQTASGGTVWREPGSEPRQVVWTAGELTFTVLTDAPVDELLLAIDELPAHPRHRVIDRLTRGLERVTGWFATLGAANDPVRSPV
jgi:hypothetical protein